MTTSSRLSIMRPSPRKFAECVMLQCQSTPHLTGHVFPIEFIYYIQWIQSYELHSYIYTFTCAHSHIYIHMCINTFTCAHTTYTQFQFTHVCISRPDYRFDRVFSVWFFTYHCFKPPVLNNGQLEFIFIMFQVVSPEQWTTWVYPLSCFKGSVLNNGQLEFILYLVSSGQS